MVTESHMYVLVIYYIVRSVKCRSVNNFVLIQPCQLSDFESERLFVFVCVSGGGGGGEGCWR